MSTFGSTALISLLSLSSVLAQSSSVGQALTATTLVSASINTALPQTAAVFDGFTIPSLIALTSNAPTDATVALDTTYVAGATPTKVSAAPAIPTLPSPANYPALDVVPPVNSTQVQAWLKEIDFSKVPAYNVTTGVCATSPSAITDGRCWWTCGGCTRQTDITSCPDKYTWGLSYDDGPSPYTPLLLDYLDSMNTTTTFFVVGSRVISRPAMVIAEYMAGHQISVHTWSHPYLTTLPNEQIVAELGWTKQVIKDTIGVTPNTFRPPYGDIDDRVRAIAAQMGLTAIIWTSMTANGTTTNFDTTDWNIPGGEATGESSLARFDQILDSADQLPGGFIVLEHDLYQQTVDLAVGYVLPSALAAGSKFTLKSINSCLGRSLNEAYIETSSNNTATRITSPSGTGTIYPAVVGTNSAGLGTVSNPVSTGATGSGTGAQSGSKTASGSTAAATTSKSGAQGRVGGVAVGAVGLLAVAMGMVFVA